MRLPALLVLALSTSAMAAPLPCGQRGAGADCVTSLVDTTGPYASRACPLEQHLAHKTRLPADCRCAPNRAAKDGIDMCKRPFDAAKAGVHLGAGPSWAHLANFHYFGGFVDAAAGELVVAASWGPNSAQLGAVVGVKLDTGDRRLISGTHEDPAGAVTTAGAGPALGNVLDVRPGPEGQLFAFVDAPKPSEHEVVRVDPTSGDRALVWKSRDPRFGQCDGGKGQLAQTHDFGFAVDADGSFLVGIANPATGRGVVRISADGKACTPVSVTAAGPLARGAGPELRGHVQGYALHGGKIVAQTTQPKLLLEIDPASGDRTVLMKGNAAGAMGERWAVWDEGRKVWWTAGLQNSVTLVGVDPARGKAFHVIKDCGSEDFPWFPLCAHGPIQINSLNLGGIWLHPDGERLLLAHDSVSIVEFEVGTGNSRILSL